MRTFRFLSFALLAILMNVGLTSCSGDDDNSNGGGSSGDNSAIVGSWWGYCKSPTGSTNSLILEFNLNNTGTMEYESSVYYRAAAFQYSISGSTIKCNGYMIGQDGEGNPFNLTLRIDGKRLRPIDAYSTFILTRDGSITTDYDGKIINGKDEEYDEEEDDILDDDQTYASTVARNVSATITTYDNYWNVSINTTLASALPGKSIEYRLGVSEDSYYTCDVTGSTFQQDYLRWIPKDASDAGVTGFYGSSLIALDKKKNSGQNLDSNEKDLYNTILSMFKKDCYKGTSCTLYVLIDKSRYVVDATKKDGNSGGNTGGNSSGDNNGEGNTGGGNTNNQDSQISSKTILYTSSSGNTIKPKSSVFNSSNTSYIVSNAYENGQGKIVFNNDITKIGKNAFSYCTDLTSITMPNSVKTIESYAFENCSGLTFITIPNSVTSIGKSAFLRSASLEAFYGKFASNDNRCLIVNGTLISFAPAGLTTYTIPNSVTSIGLSAFNKCTDLTSITIPGSVTEIEKYAFAYCAGLTSVAIPNSVKTIGDDAFYSCSGLTTITIPNSVTSIGSNAFNSCTELTSITIPNSVTTIRVHAFYDCSNLTSVTIPNSVKTIEKGAFSKCI